jgi:2-polyprenyl-3-methyl-5-hydroxy-6-metoxy-1,4-benzoquinol methylase
MINFISPKTQQLLEKKGDFLTTEKGENFPIINDIPRFVEQDNYASAFGYQWKKYALTQLDSHNGTKISLERLERCLGFSIGELKGKNILEVGSGAGRFTEHLVQSGANVHSIDLSVAVEVNKENVGEANNYCIAQASVYEIPFPKETFDVVICLGVIQHTPSTEKTIDALWQMVKPGGMMVIDHYMWRWNYYFNPATYWRLCLKEMKPERSMKIVDALVKFFFPLHWASRNCKICEWLLKRISPVMHYINEFPLINKVDHFELSRLDSYDSLTDYYKWLKTPSEINIMLKKINGKNIWVNIGGNGVEARCYKI